MWIARDPNIALLFIRPFPWCLPGGFLHHMIINVVKPLIQGNPAVCVDVSLPGA